MPTATERNVLLTHCLDCDVEGSTEVVVTKRGRGERSSSTKVQISFDRTKLDLIARQFCGPDDTIPSWSSSTVVVLFVLIGWNDAQCMNTICTYQKRIVLTVVGSPRVRAIALR